MARRFENYLREHQGKTMEIETIGGQKHTGPLLDVMDDFVTIGFGDSPTPPWAFPLAHIARVRHIKGSARSE